jgi:uncharacterized delta-60 repeat protein
MSPRSASLLLGLAVSVASLCHAADGDVDVAFGTDAEFPGYGFYLNPMVQGELDTAVAIAAAPDGKLWYFGNFDDGQNGNRAAIWRLEADGWFDYDFGDAGLRTLVPPCPNGWLSHATLDAQGRPLLAFSNCGDFEVYRLTPDGDPDTSLLGSGRLTIAFDMGGSNNDRPMRIAGTLSGGIVVAGSVANADTGDLGIAHFTSEGGAAPGFGNAGRVTLPFAWSVTRVGGVHPMADGRIVAAGDTQQNPFAMTQFAVRVQPNGAPDLGFGNSAPGISEANIRTLSGFDGGASFTRNSLLEPTGSIIQAGTYYDVDDAAAGSEMFLLRWREDGELDTTLGPYGYRVFGLDLGGAGENNDGLDAIARQGDGKYVLAGYSHNADNRAELTLVRLRRDFSLDPQFGDGGMLHHLVPIAQNGFPWMSAEQILLRPGRIITSLLVGTGPGNLMSLRGSQNDQLFADMFD